MKNKVDHYFDKCLYFSLAKMQRNINSLAEQSFKKLDIAPSHAFLLIALNEEEKLSSSELADILGVSVSTLTRFVDKLITKKLCEREYDGRFSYVKITSHGQYLIQEIEKCWHDLFDSYNEYYGKQAAKELNNMIVDLNNKSSI